MSSHGKPGPKATSRLRLLTPDEEDLWSLAVRTIRPLQPAPPARKSVTNPVEAKNKAAVRKMPRPAKNEAVSPPKAAEPAKCPAAPSPPALNQIMRREKQKLARGHAMIDARIDLHGMTQTEAHAALRTLLQRAQADGAKFVLVITGKGLPNAPFNGRGVLRRQVPLWLALPEFRRYVAGFDVANAGHGGEGALYVRLRKRK